MLQSTRADRHRRSARLSAHQAAHEAKRQGVVHRRRKPRLPRQRLLLGPGGEALDGGAEVPGAGGELESRGGEGRGLWAGQREDGSAAADVRQTVNRLAGVQAVAPHSLVLLCHPHRPSSWHHEAFQKEGLRTPGAPGAVWLIHKPWGKQGRAGRVARGQARGVKGSPARYPPQRCLTRC